MAPGIWRAFLLSTRPRGGPETQNARAGTSWNKTVQPIGSLHEVLALPPYVGERAVESVEQKLDRVRRLLWGLRR